MDLKKISKLIGLFLLSIVGISTIQWICIQIIASYCAPWGWLGPIQNILSLGSPVCQFLNHLQVGLGDYYITIWAAAATAGITYIVTNTNISQ